MGQCGVGAGCERKASGCLGSSVARSGKGTVTAALLELTGRDERQKGQEEEQKLVVLFFQAGPFRRVSSCPWAIKLNSANSPKVT